MIICVYERFEHLGHDKSWSNLLSLRFYLRFSEGLGLNCTFVQCIIVMRLCDSELCLSVVASAQA